MSPDVAYTESDFFPLYYNGVSIVAVRTCTCTYMYSFEKAANIARSQRPLTATATGNPCIYRSNSCKTRNRRNSTS